MSSKPNKPQRAPPASDYETDTDAAHLASLPLPPPRTNEQLNLSVLRRFESSITSILSYASYSVLYVFQPDGQWEKCGIEGTLFVCSLTPSPIGAERYTVIILNRRGLDNFITELKSPDNVDVTDEYIILQVAGKDGSPQIYGLWIFAEPPPSSTSTARTMNAETIRDCAERAENSRAAAEQQQGQAMAQAEAAAEAATGEHSVDMNRSLSLTELFGQQREQDSDFTIHNHHQNQSATEQAQQQPPVQMPVAPGTMTAPVNTGTPQFAPTPDNDFFLSGPRPTAQPPQPVNQAQATQLLQLFQTPQAQVQPQTYNGFFNPALTRPWEVLQMRIPGIVAIIEGRVIRIERLGNGDLHVEAMRDARVDPFSADSYMPLSPTSRLWTGLIDDGTFWDEVESSFWDWLDEDSAN